MSKRPILIIPGAWQKPAAFDEITRKLIAAGYPTELVPLPTVGGTTAPLPGLADDVAAVRVALARLQSRACRPTVEDANKNAASPPPLLLAHSSGGLVASNAAQGVDVGGIVFLAAFVVPRGTSLLDLLGGQPLPWMDVQGDRVFGVPELVSQIAFSDLDDEARERWAREMTFTSAALFGTPSEFEPWANGVPCGYICCSADNALPFPAQQQMAAELGPETPTATLRSGHCPFLSVPDELVEAVVAIESRMR